jgi:Pyruvate/2-oxoacid:ferredoxin oxidoreductase delta subunit
VRVSSLTGKEKCTVCLTYCPKCSKIVEKTNLIRDSSGAMVCKSCGSGQRRSVAQSGEMSFKKISTIQIFHNIYKVLFYIS